MIENWDKYKDLEYYPDRVCVCGGKIKVRPHHSWAGIPKYCCSGHSRIGKRRPEGSGRKKVLREVKVCALKDCNNIVKSGEKYCSPECYWKSMMGGKQSMESNRKRSKTLQGRKHTEEWNRNMSVSLKGPRVPRETRTCARPGCDITFECEVNSKRKYCCHPCASNDISKSSSRNKKIGDGSRRAWQNPEQRDRRIRASMKGNGFKPNKPEKFLTKLLQKLIPNEYKYVGDGEFILAGKCPDFVNINGQKKIIEMFGDYWHGEERTGRTKEENEQERVSCFAQYGYKTLII